MEMFSSLTGTSLLLIVAFSTLNSAWPIGFQDDAADYLAFRPPTDWSNLDGEENGPVEDAANPEGNEINYQPSWRPMERMEPLPRTKFQPLQEAQSGDGGAGHEFKFVKPSAPIVKQRSVIPIKTHVPTISDETPLYLNYAEKDDNSHRIPPLAVNGQLPKNMTPPVGTAQEVTDEETPDEDDDTENGDKKEDPRLLMLSELADDEKGAADVRQEEQPEIDFTQRLAFPDFNVPEAKILRGDEESPLDKITIDEILNEDRQNNEEENNNLQEQINQATLEEDEEEEVAPIPETPSTETPVYTTATTQESTHEHHMVKIVAPAVQPQNLQAPPQDLHYVPVHDLGFFLKSVDEKRGVQKEGGSSNTSSILVPVIAVACTCAAVFASICAAIFYRRSIKKRPYLDAEEPSYGVTGPPVKPTFLDLNGDRSLAKSAETYHYQNQKRQILSSVENNPSSGGSTEPKSGDHSDYDTEGEDEDGEDYGDYTVYECPGLAPPGEIEVLNPMFTAQKKDDSSEE